MAKKYYSFTELNDKFKGLTVSEKNRVLFGALDYMQQYNGRKIKDCIFLSMGFEPSVNPSGLSCWVKRR